MSNLVLTRNEGQRIIIGDGIIITIAKITNKQVKVAIDAPRNVPIHREEIYKKIQKEGYKP